MSQPFCALRICNPQHPVCAFIFGVLGDYKSPGFNRSNLFLRRIANPPERLAGDFLLNKQIIHCNLFLYDVAMFVLLLFLSVSISLGVLPYSFYIISFLNQSSNTQSAMKMPSFSMLINSLSMRAFLMRSILDLLPSG